MELLTEKPETVFHTSAIRMGDLLYAKHVSWKEGMGGFVAAVTDKEIVVQYHPRIGNVTNHFFIQAKDVAAGNWEIRYSADLSEVLTYPESKEDPTEDRPEMEVSYDIRGAYL